MKPCGVTLNWKKKKKTPLSLTRRSWKSRKGGADGWEGSAAHVWAEAERAFEWWNRGRLSVNCVLFFFFHTKKKKRTTNFCVVSQRLLDPLIIKLTGFIQGDVRTSQSGAERSRRCLLNSPRGPLRAKWETGDWNSPFCERRCGLFPRLLTLKPSSDTLIQAPLNIVIFFTYSDQAAKLLIKKIRNSVTETYKYEEKVLIVYKKIILSSLENSHLTLISFFFYFSWSWCPRINRVASTP